MQQHLLNISYLLTALFVCTTNPIMTIGFLVVLYMRGELTQFLHPFITGFLSLADMTVYIVPFAIVTALIIAMFKSAAKHPWWNR